MGDNKLSIALAISLLNLTMKNESQMTCPVCEERHPKNALLKVNFQENVFRCPKCDAKGGVIHFYGLFKYRYPREFLDERPDIRKQLAKEMYNGGKSSGLLAADAPPRPLYVSKDVPAICERERDRTYSTLLRKLKLEGNHYANLIERGLRPEDIEAFGYKSVPKMGFSKIPNELRKEACDLEGVPGFYKKNSIWTLCQTKSGFYIPVRDVPEGNQKVGYIQGMQIRFDDKAADPRYKWLSTKDMESGCAAETYAHFRGYPASTLILTEGPLKADIIYRYLNIPVAAVPGVSSIKKFEEMLPKLWAMGFRKIRTAFDMDYKSNPNVSEAYVKLCKMLMGHGFYVERLTWDDKHKGFDDFLNNVHKIQYGVHDVKG